MSSNPDGRTAFFYGTLMAPAVLHRVCHGSSSPTNPIFATHNLRTHAALLPNHQRRRVKSADYPAILPHPTSTVRGTYVTGLTDSDIWRLDIFEGSEYERVKVKCKLLEPQPPKTFSGIVTSGDERVQLGSVFGADGREEVEAETYLWIGGEARLEEREWDLEEFQREKMRFWVGEEGREEYAEVDEAVAEAKQDGTGGRGANGTISSALAEEHKKDDVLKSAV